MCNSKQIDFDPQINVNRLTENKTLTNCHGSVSEGTTEMWISDTVINVIQNTGVNPTQEQEQTREHNIVDPTNEERTDWDLNTWDNERNAGQQND